MAFTLSFGNNIIFEMLSLWGTCPSWDRSTLTDLWTPQINLISLILYWRKILAYWTDHLHVTIHTVAQYILENTIEIHFHEFITWLRTVWLWVHKCLAWRMADNCTWRYPVLQEFPTLTSTVAVPTWFITSNYLLLYSTLQLILSYHCYFDLNAEFWPYFVNVTFSTGKRK